MTQTSSDAAITVLRDNLFRLAGENLAVADRIFEYFMRDAEDGGIVNKKRTTISAGTQRRAAREEMAKRGSREMPELPPGRYLAVIDSVSGEFFIDIEFGDLWIIDAKGDRHLHFAFAGIGGGFTFGASASRQFGALYVSSAANVEGISGHIEFDGTVGYGPSSSAQWVNSSFDAPATFGGIGLGMEVGLSGVLCFTWFKKAYRKTESPLLLPPGIPS